MAFNRSNCALWSADFTFLPTTGYQTTQTIRDEIAAAKSLLINAGYKTGARKFPFGIAYFVWELDKDGNDQAHEKLDAALDNDVQSIWLSFGNDPSEWVQYIRSKDLAKPGSPRTKIFILVNSLTEALKAHELGADVIVAQGMSRPSIAP